jgi:hypothetical protein
VRSYNTPHQLLEEQGVVVSQFLSQALKITRKNRYLQSLSKKGVDVPKKWRNDGEMYLLFIKK